MKPSRRKSVVYLMLWLLCPFLCPKAQANEPSTAPPKKIVSLAPSITEMLFALGFGDRLVGVTTYCDYPAEARQLPKIGGFMSPSIEAIVAKRPDLVIGVTGATDPIKAREMERLGLKVNLISLKSLEEILNGIKSVARSLGNPSVGEKLTAKIGTQVQDVRRRVAGAPRRSVLLVVGIRPVVAVGGQNFIDELITLAGGENIAGNASQPWLNLPDEYVVAKAPQVIIEAGMGSEKEDSAKHWQDLKSVAAVREKRIYYYRSDKILRPGPRVGEALLELAQFIHPECFVNPTENRAILESRCERPKP